MQQWRGVPSHFNASTPFDEVAFSGAGILIFFTVLVIAIVTLWTFFPLQAPRSLGWAIQSGMALLIVSQIMGVMLVINGLSKMEFDPQTGEFMLESIKSASIFGAAGSMKILHALSLHAIQVLPVLALLLRFTNWNEIHRTEVVVAAMVGYSGLETVSIWQTFSGLPADDLRLLAALVFGISAVSLVVAYAAALLGIQRTMAQARP